MERRWSSLRTRYCGINQTDAKKETWPWALVQMAIGDALASPPSSWPRAKVFGFSSTVFHRNDMIWDNLEEVGWCKHGHKPELCWQVFNDHCFMYSDAWGHEHKRLRPVMWHPSKRLLQQQDEDARDNFEDMAPYNREDFISDVPAKRRKNLPRAGSRTDHTRSA